MFTIKNDVKIIKVIVILLILSITPFIRGCSGISEPTETITVGFPVPIITSYFNTSDGRVAYKPCFPSDVYPFNLVFNLVILSLIGILLYRKRSFKISQIFLIPFGKSPGFNPGMNGDFFNAGGSPGL